MIKKIILFGWELTFVFRHRWESEDDRRVKEYNHETNFQIEIDSE